MKIIAIVPAYNEEVGIAKAIEALQEQWCPPITEIVVVANNCTDRTADVARASGASVWEMPGHNPHKKAGALNWAITHALTFLGDGDYIIVSDADSRLTADWTGHALRALRGSRVLEGGRGPAGAACANFYIGEEHGNGILTKLQRAEYERFALQVRQRGKAIVLSGVATMFEVGLIREVIAARGNRLPGYLGEFYNRDAATEDIELTYAVKSLGYTPLAPKEAVVWTDSMPTLKALSDQRERWQRGMLDTIRLYGVNRLTAGAVGLQALIYAGSLVVPLYLAFLCYAAVTQGAVPFDPRWLILNLLFMAERALTTKHHRLMAAALLPEWLYEQFRSIVFWKALYKTARKSPSSWINAPARKESKTRIPAHAAA